MFRFVVLLFFIFNITRYIKLYYADVYYVRRNGNLLYLIKDKGLKI